MLVAVLKCKEMVGLNSHERIFQEGSCEICPSTAMLYARKYCLFVSVLCKILRLCNQ